MRSVAKGLDDTTFKRSGADLEENLTGVHQLGSPVCIVGAPFLGGSGGMPPREIFEN